MRKLLLWLLLLWPVAGSAASPVPQNLYAEIDHGLRPVVVLADPESYRGRILLLGGVVERTVSEPGGVTLTVACQGVDVADRPAAGIPQCGRILATGAGLDGARLQPGRLVTLVGVVTGWGETGAGRLAQLEIRFIHPWPTAAEEQASRRPTYPPGYWCDPWGYDPWCGPRYYGPYPRWRFGLGYSRHWH